MNHVFPWTRAALPDHSKKKLLLPHPTHMIMKMTIIVINGCRIRSLF